MLGVRKAHEAIAAQACRDRRRARGEADAWAVMLAYHKEREVRGHRNR